MSRKIICDNCQNVALNGVENGWVVFSGWSNSISDPYFSIGVVTGQNEYELVPYNGLDFCSYRCLTEWFKKLIASKGQLFLSEVEDDK